MECRTGDGVLGLWDWAQGRVGEDSDALWVVPRKTKTEQLGRPATQVLTRCDQFPAGCAVRRLFWYWEAQSVASVPISEGDCVFRCHRGGAAAGVSSAALQHRLRRAVTLHLPGSAYTLHSFRRGRLQTEAHVRGTSHDALQRLAGIKDAGVLMRYLDEGRHL